MEALYSGESYHKKKHTVDQSVQYEVYSPVQKNLPQLFLSCSKQQGSVSACQVGQKPVGVSEWLDKHCVMLCNVILM